MRDAPDRRAGVRGPSVGIACIAAALSFTLGWALLEADHPADDAYILFRYADHIAQGHGSVFNVGGPRAEGATDFLWLMALSAGVRAGVDVAFVALLLNALGAGFLAGCLARGALAARAPWPARAALLPVALSVVVGHAALPAYVGFSTLAYAALFGALAELAAEPRGSSLWRWPAGGLVLGLFRPDGVVAGVAYSALGLWHARQLGRVRSYLFALAACGGLGVLYFLGRAAYFGLWLPLPLYVKSHADAAPEGAGVLLQLAALLPGLPTTWRWLTGPSTPLPLLCVLGGLLLALHRRRPAEVHRLLAMLAPPALMIAAFCVAVQSQNVGYRFQAPAATVALLAMMRAAAVALETFPSPRARALVVICALLAAGASSFDGARATSSLIARRSHFYLPTFAVLLGSQIERDRVLALTEAGMVPYWSDVRAEDLVGLNSPSMAVNAPRASDVRALAPDLVFFNHAGTLDATRLVGERLGRGVVRLERETLRAALRPELAPAYALDSPAHGERRLRPVVTAALVLERFLIEGDAYEILAVDARGRGGYEHIYGLRRDASFAASIVDLLVRTMGRQVELSYLDARRLRAHQK